MSEAVWTAVCRGVVVPLGWLTSRRTRLYHYLWRSVMDMDSVETVMRRMVDAGFEDVRTRSVARLAERDHPHVPRAPPRMMPAPALAGPLGTRSRPAGGPARAAGCRRSRPGWTGPPTAVVVGGGIAGLAAATGLAERGVAVTLVEAAPTLGGRVRAWPVAADGTSTTMSRGFHAFFRQYYNLRALLRRSDPTLARLRPVADYPLVLAGGHTDSFAGLPTRPPLNLMAFVARSPSFTLRDLTRVDADAALGLLDVAFPRTYEDYAGRSAAEVLDELRFPDGARHLALEVFARSFFADPRELLRGRAGRDVPHLLPGVGRGAALRRALRRLRHGAVGAARPTTSTGSGVRVVMPMAATRWRTAAASGGRAARGRVGGRGRRRGAGDRPGAVAAARRGSPLAGRRAVADAAGLAAARRRRSRSGGCGSTDRSREGTPPFLATSGFGPLDNVSAVHQFEAGAGRWARARGGSVVEVHAYALPDGTDEAALRVELRRPAARPAPGAGPGGRRPRGVAGRAPTARWSGPSRGGTGPRSARRTRGSRWRGTGSAATTRSR